MRLVVSFVTAKKRTRCEFCKEKVEKGQVGIAFPPNREKVVACVTCGTVKATAGLDLDVARDVRAELMQRFRVMKHLFEGGGDYDTAAA